MNYRKAIDGIEPESLIYIYSHMHTSESSEQKYLGKKKILEQEYTITSSCVISCSFRIHWHTHTHYPFLDT